MYSIHKLSSQMTPMMATISTNYTTWAPFESLLQLLLTGKLPQETHELQVIRRDTDLFTLTCWTWFLRNESTHLIMLVLTLILYNFLISIRGIIVLEEQSIKSTQMQCLVLGRTTWSCSRDVHVLISCGLGFCFVFSQCFVIVTNGCLKRILHIWWRADVHLVKASNVSLWKRSRQDPTDLRTWKGSGDGLGTP